MAFIFDDAEKDFWGNRLEVNHEQVTEHRSDAALLRTWVNSLGPRIRPLLADYLDIDLPDKLSEQRDEFTSHGDDLLPLMLVDEFSSGKRSYAVTEVAHARLDAADVSEATISGEKYDILVLLWLLYLSDPKNLELVFHLDRMQRKGFARMVLDVVPPAGAMPLSDFFKPGNLQTILDDYETVKNTHKQSHCAAVLTSGGRYQVFVKRDWKPSFVSHGPENTFGWEREWIILEFDPDLARVHICSISPDVPTALADRIASDWFGEQVWYDNEIIVTDPAKAAAFVHLLIADPDPLPLVEVALANSPLQGSVQLCLNDETGKSVAPALKHLEALVGSDPVADIHDIDSIKVIRFKKRVKMIFERQDNSDKVIVRYSDQPLTGKERIQFEQEMATTYGLTVLSTEKRYAGTA